MSVKPGQHVTFCRFRRFHWVLAVFDPLAVHGLRLRAAQRRPQCGAFSAKRRPKPTSVNTAAGRAVPSTETVAHSLVGAEEAGIGKIGWHAFRRSYATLLHSSGTSLAVLKGLLRDTDVWTAVNIYTQALSWAKRDASCQAAGTLWRQQVLRFCTFWAKWLPERSPSERKEWSGRPDLNWGPLGPEPSALPGYATPRRKLWSVTSGGWLGSKPNRSCARH